MKCQEIKSQNNVNVLIDGYLRPAVAEWKRKNANKKFLLPRQMLYNSEFTHQLVVCLLEQILIESQ